MDTQPHSPPASVPTASKPRKPSASWVVGVVFLCIAGLLLVPGLYFVFETANLLESPEMQNSTSPIGLVLAITSLLSGGFLTLAAALAFSGLLLVPKLRSPKKTVLLSAHDLEQYKTKTLLFAFAWLGLAAASVLLFAFQVQIPAAVLLPFVYLVAVPFGIGGGVRYLTYYVNARRVTMPLDGVVPKDV